MIELGNVRLFTLAEVSQKLKLSKASLRRYIKGHRLSGQKVGNSWLISEDALRQFFLSPYVGPKKAGEGKKARAKK